MKNLFFTAVVILISIPGIKAQENAADIVKKSEAVMRSEGFESRSKLVITDEKGRIRVRENITASMRFDDGSVRRIIRFLSPADIAGTTMLIHDYEDKADDIWIYLPALKRTRRMVSSEKSRSFMGSDFSNGDMTTPPDADFRHTLLESESKGDFWVIESFVVTPELVREYGYSKRKSLYSKADYAIRGFTYYDETGTPGREITIDELYRSSDGKIIISKMTAKNLRKGSVSTIELSEINTMVSTDRGIFDPGALGK